MGVFVGVDIKAARRKAVWTIICSAKQTLQYCTTMTIVRLLLGYCTTMTIVRLLLGYSGINFPQSPLIYCLMLRLWIMRLIVKTIIHRIKSISTQDVPYVCVHNRGITVVGGPAYLWGGARGAMPPNQQTCHSPTPRYRRNYNSTAMEECK